MVRGLVQELSVLEGNPRSSDNDRIQVLLGLGTCERLLKNLEAAESRLLLADKLAAGISSKSVYRQELARELYMLYVDWGKPTEAEQWRAKLKMPQDR